MAIRFDDTRRSLSCSVHDLLEASHTAGHLRLDVVQSAERRLAAGRHTHQLWQEQRSDEDPEFRAEVRLSHSFEVSGWTAKVSGRVDGLLAAPDRTVVEEVKSTVLDASRLLSTTAADWPRYVEQVQLYLWMLHNEAWPSPVGRLVFVSLADGSRHVVGLALNVSQVEALVLRRLRELVHRRERRLAWLVRRRARRVPDPFDAWRPGQLEIASQVAESLAARRPVVIEAPTGMGKTAAVLASVLRYALQHNKQVFWATARNTQQNVVSDTLERLRERGLAARAVRLTAKEKVCLNDVVSCTPERCPYAENYYDKLGEGDVLARSLAMQGGDRAHFMALGRQAVVCPYQLALDVGDEVDVVVGDYNYVFSPDVRLTRWFGERAEDWIVVVDEAHQLVERARSYGSPRVDAALARSALELLRSGGASYVPFAEVAREVVERIAVAGRDTDCLPRGGQVVVELDRAAWRSLGERVDALGLEYAILEQQRPLVEEGSDDPWKDTARALLRLCRALEAAGSETVTVAGVEPGKEWLGTLCLDPSRLLQPIIAELGGWVGCSATLSPARFYRDLLGLPQGAYDRLELPSPFPAVQRRVLVASRVSTAWRDRAAHADRTARLLEALAAATPGGLALYFPSFAMLDDLISRCTFPDREVLRQTPGMVDEDRERWLQRLGSGEGRPVLAAVLGGIFAEGIDLPAGALDAVAVVGPALPPTGLERDLLRAYHDEHHGDGFLYASLVPGITKVAQAAGRLFRRPEDRGVVVLIGRRFRRQDVVRLLPEWWNVEHVTDVPATMRSFFARVP